MALKGFGKRLCLLLMCIALTLCTYSILHSIVSEKMPMKEDVGCLSHSGYRFSQSSGQQLFLKPSADIDPQVENGSGQIRYSRWNYKSHPWMLPRPISELENNVVPNQVYFIWCQNKTFTFSEYLSVISCWKLLEPDVLEIHQGAAIRIDKYNQWLLELRQTIPVFNVIPITRKSMCTNPLQYALELLNDRGGIYVNFSTILLRPVHFLRKQNFSLALNENGHVAFMISQRQSRDLKRILSRSYTLDPINTTKLLESSVEKTHPCPTLYRSPSVGFQLRRQGNVTCVTISSDFSWGPLDLLKIQEPSLIIFRDLFYMDLGYENKCDSCEESGNQGAIIPFYVHYVWFGSSELSFRMYLSFLSTVRIAKADRIYIHCDLYLHGQYWETVSKHPKVIVVYREPPTKIFGHPILYSQHRSDVVRADLLEKYGGIYVDWDVLWLQSPVSLLSSGHDALVNLDHMNHPPFRDMLNLGVFLAKPRSRFVRLWRRELRNYRSQDFAYNALELPFKVYERHPDSVFIEKRLQVMCFWLKCHPIFHAEHKDWTRAQPFDWRTDVYSIHFTHPDPVEYQSLQTMLNASGTFADIGKFIWNQSGLLADGN